MLLTTPEELGYIPKRIISVVPSQTELLYYLGLQKQTAGITKFCILPKKWFTTKERVGGTKTINLKKIASLQPDLIIANKEENVKEQIQALAKDYPVWLTDVNSLADALQMIKDIGILTGKQQKATQLAAGIKKNFSSLKPIIRLNTCYLIWRKPYMAAAGGTFINDMLGKCGFKNILAYTDRYPVVNTNQLATANCQLLLLSSEPYPFKQKHINELQAALPGCRILLADGEMFSWYGSRLLKSPAYLKSLQKQLVQ